MSVRRRQSAPLIALIVLGCIVYASLRPFSGWSSWLEGARWFPFTAQGWGRLRWFDFSVNALIYVPLGWALAMSLPAAGGRVAVGAAMALAFTLSLALETVQMWLPMREASMLDVAANVLGAVVGIAIAAWLTAHQHYASLTRLRERWFLPGRRGTIGITLLGVWLLAHLNPVIPLYASTYLPPADLAREPSLPYLEVIQTSLNFLGVALFADLLLMRRYEAGWMVIGITLSALCTKAIAAWLLLKPIAWGAWLRPAVTLGFALGVLVLLGFFRLQRRWKSVIANVCLLVGLGLTFLIPEWGLTEPPLRLFNRELGHLISFNGLTHGILLLWPLLASLYLATGAVNHDLPETMRRF